MKYYLKSFFLPVLINIITMLLFYSLILFNCVHIYELEDIYNGNFHLYVILFVASILISYILGLLQKNKDTVLVLFFFTLFVTGIVSVFLKLPLSPNGSSFYIILRKTFNVSESITAEIVSEFFSAIIVSFVFYLGENTTHLLKNK